MKKTIKRLLGVALALVMCLTMAPATTAKADEAVALSEYTENQLVAAFMGEWEGVNRGEYAILSRDHIKMWNIEKDETVIDADWTYDGVVELEGRVLTYEDFENMMSGDIQLEKVDGTWVDRDGNVYDEKDVTKTEGEIEGVYVEEAYESVVYEDGVWKDKTGNVYEEENVVLGDFYIGEVLVTSRDDGLREGSNGSVYQYIDGAWHEYLTDNVYERKDITPVNGSVCVSEGGWEKERAYVEYVDGAWKDDDGNVYAEESLDYIYGEIEFNLDSKTKALKFTGSGYVVYLYVEYSEWAGERVVRVQYTNETTEHDGSMYLLSKSISENEGCYVDELLEAALTATEAQEEEPKAEEPVEETETEEAPSTAFIKGEDDEALTTLTLEVGELHDLNFDGIDDFNEDNYSYTWISTYPEVAKVDQKGNVTAVTAGSTTIKVAIVDNRDGSEVEVTPVVITVPTVIVEEEPTEVPVETPVEEPTTEEPTGEAPVETEDTDVEEPKTEEPTETPVEEPKAEDTATETPAEEPKTEDKEIVEKTKDGRDVYTGETVYIVKKGDCLWNIAKQVLGNGARYKELFTRNNGIIEKAKLIFPGQEVIVPAK